MLKVLRACDIVMRPACRLISQLPYQNVDRRFAAAPHVVDYMWCVCESAVNILVWQLAPANIDSLPLCLSCRISASLPILAAVITDEWRLRFTRSNQDI